jgi:pimeloyl-ACP methyl ester carboxylesterase
MPLLNVANVTLFYNDTGKGNTLVVIHGNGSSLKMYESEIKHYSLKNRVLAFDLPGHGKSADVLNCGDMNYWEFCGMAINLALKQLKINDFTILGVNGGAIVGLYLAIHAGGKVNGIFADSFEGNELPQNRVLDIVNQRQQLQQFFFFRLFYRYIHGKYWRTIMEKDSARLLDFAKHKGIFFKEQLNVFCPVTLTCSAKDNMIPGIVQKMGILSKLIHNSQVVVFEGGRHPACLSNKKAYRKMLVSFLLNQK